MDPIAQTAYYCCGARALDARSAHPVCGDQFAARFMDAEAQAVFQRFKDFHAPNAANAVRHRIVDDLLRQRLQAAPATHVLLLGAGFDTRAFRLQGGHWLELDAPALLARKEAALPAAGAPNPLQRVAIDFAHDDLAERLAPWAGMRDAVVVMEGVSMYLDDAPWRQTAAVLQRLLPGHRLICDLTTRRFVRLYSAGLRREIQALGGDFAPAMDDPASYVVRLGYRRRSVCSIAARAAELGAVPVPPWLLATLLRSLRDGYQVYEFDAPAAASATA